jgi:Restriction endonuclease
MPTLSFDHLSDTKFEEFGFDLLHALNFVNIDWRKGTALGSSPSDNGRDIVAQQLREDVDQTTHLETWFVDCKHYKRGVPPTELQNLLSWAEAERPDVALFLVSGFLSNPSKNYLESYKRNNKPPFKIKYWEKPQLERMTTRKMTLLRKHDLTEAPLRSVKQILKAEQEFFDRVWYDRSLLGDVIRKRDGTKLTPKIRKGMMAARKRIEAQYGGKKALMSYYKDDFGWGFMNGKLSALRWVLGDDWDMLDT